MEQSLWAAWRATGSGAKTLITSSPLRSGPPTDAPSSSPLPLERSKSMIIWGISSSMSSFIAISQGRRRSWLVSDGIYIYIYIYIVIIRFDGGLNGYITENYPEENPTLCICYQNGKMQLMKHENDDMPITIDSGMRINSVNWSPNGTILSIGGQFKEGEDVKSAVQFYTPHGNHLRTLRVRFI